MSSPYAQEGYRVRFDWGPPGANTIGVQARIVAVVDVLSFTTALTVAVGRGIDVYPYRWRDESAVEYARSRDAVLAVGRSEATRAERAATAAEAAGLVGLVEPTDPAGLTAPTAPAETASSGKISLSPATIQRAQGIRRLVLPSPNGSTIAQDLAGKGSTVIGVCLRNAGAAARWAAQKLGPQDFVAVVAAGERWVGDGSLRPAVEDLWGAGGFIHALAGLGVGPLSPEAEMAAAAFTRFAARPSLADCASGRELIAYGYPEDVEVAAELDSDDVVPVLTGECFTPAA